MLILRLLNGTEDVTFSARGVKPRCWTARRITRGEEMKGRPPATCGGERGAGKLMIRYQLSILKTDLGKRAQPFSNSSSMHHYLFS